MKLFKIGKKCKDNRSVEMKKILGGYQSRNTAGHHGWPTKKIFYFKPSKRLERFNIGRK